MQPHSLSLWWLRIATFSAAALAAASAAYWVLELSAAAPQALTPHAPLAGAPLADTRMVARLLGGGQTASPAGQNATPAMASSQFKLVGVVTERGRDGYALIAINGQPAKPYRVGTPVGDTLVLHSVTARSAALAADVQAPASVQLDLPALAPAQSGGASR